MSYDDFGPYKLHHFAQDVIGPNPNKRGHNFFQVILLQGRNWIKVSFESVAGRHSDSVKYSSGLTHSRLLDHRASGLIGIKPSVVVKSCSVTPMAPEIEVWHWSRGIIANDEDLTVQGVSMAYEWPNFVLCSK